MPAPLLTPAVQQPIQLPLRPQSSATLYIPLLPPPPLPAPALPQIAKQLLHPNPLPASTFLTCCYPPCQLPPFIGPLSCCSAPESYATPYICLLLPPPLPTPTLQQLAKLPLRPNILPPSTIPSYCHPPCQLPPCSRLSSNSSGPIYSQPLHSAPAAIPPAISHTAAERQATQPPQSTPTLYKHFQLPLTLPTPAFQQLAKMLLRRNMLPRSTSPSSRHHPCQLSPSSSSSSCPSAPIHPQPLHSSPAATPPANSRFPSAH